MRVGVYIPEISPLAGGGFTFVESVLGVLRDFAQRHSFVLFEAEEKGRAGGEINAWVREERVDIVWFPTPDYEPVDAPFIATVWDLEHRRQPYFPEVSTSGWRWEERELFYRSVLPRAAFVISSTHVGRGDIERYYQVPPERISVLPFPTPKFPDVDASAPLELPVASPYLLYPAQFWPHKNHVGLLHTLRILTETHGLDFSIAFTGTDKGNLGHVRAVAEQLGLTQRVGFLGFVERSVLADLYRNAFALAFASFFGPDNLPPLEAFALGCPVIAGDAPGAREQLGDAALLVDLFDDEGFARAVRQLVDTPALRSELIARGATRASWSAHDYVGGLCRLLDGFAAVRRCWSSTEPFVHL